MRWLTSSDFKSCHHIRQLLRMRKKQLSQVWRELRSDLVVYKPCSQSIYCCWCHLHNQGLNRLLFAVVRKVRSTRTKGETGNSWEMKTYAIPLRPICYGFSGTGATVFFRIRKRQFEGENHANVCCSPKNKGVPSKGSRFLGTGSGAAEEDRGRRMPPAWTPEEVKDLPQS